MDLIAVLIDVIDLSIEPWIMALAATQMCIRDRARIGP